MMMILNHLFQFLRFGDDDIKSFFQFLRFGDDDGGQVLGHLLPADQHGLDFDRVEAGQ